MNKLEHVNAEEIKGYLTELNEELRAMDVKGEICCTVELLWLWHTRLDQTPTM